MDNVNGYLKPLTEEDKQLDFESLSSQQDNSIQAIEENKSAVNK